MLHVGDIFPYTRGNRVFRLLLETFGSVLSALNGSGDRGRNSTGGAIRVKLRGKANCKCFESNAWEAYIPIRTIDAVVWTTDVVT